MNVQFVSRPPTLEDLFNFMGEKETALSATPAQERALALLRADRIQIQKIPGPMTQTVAFAKKLTQVVMEPARKLLGYNSLGLLGSGTMAAWGFVSGFPMMGLIGAAGMVIEGYYTVKQGLIFNEARQSCNALLRNTHGYIVSQIPEHGE